MDLKSSNEELELIYGYHCFEYSEKDRYMIFVNFYLASKVKYNKVDMEGKIICNGLITIESNLYSDPQNYW